MRQDARRHVLAIALLVVGVGLTYGAGWLRPTTAQFEVDFSNIPMEVLDLKGQQVPVSPADAAYLEADAMVALQYGTPGNAVGLNLIYGGGWRTVHTPEGCLPASGWRIVWDRALEIPMGEDAPHPGPLHAKLLRAEGEEEAQLVLFVFAHKGGTAADWAAHSWAVATGPGGAGGLSLMLTAAVAPGAEQQVETRLREFMGVIYPHAVSFWYEGDG